MKKLIPLILFICGHLGAIARLQEPTALPLFQHVGTVMDSVNKNPLSFAWITLYNHQNELVKKVLTQTNGQYSFSVPSSPTWTIIISFAGYESKKLVIQNHPDSIIYSNTILLSPITMELEPVSIVATRPLITYQGEKFIYNAEDDPESESSSLMDILKKLPALSIDPEEKLQLNGNSDFLVLLNGKKTSLFVRNPSEIFRSFPASTVSKIEIMTTPPARFESEGAGGVINIILRNRQVNGYNASLSAGAGYPQSINNSGFLTVRVGKVGYSGYAGYNGSILPKNQSDFSRTDYIRNSKLSMGGEGTGQSKGFNYNNTLSVDIDSLNLLNVDFGVYSNKSGNQYNQLMQFFGGNEILTSAYTNQSDARNYWRSRELGADFQHTFRSNPNKLITISFKQLIDEDSSTGMFSVSPILNTEQQQSMTKNFGRFNEKTLQADYVQPIGKHSLELGMKWINRLTSSDFNFLMKNPASGLFFIDTSFSDRFNYDQQIAATYASVNFRSGKSNFTTGIRLENAWVTANYETTKTRAQNTYFNVLPSLNWSYKLKPNATLTTGFVQRIERPGLNYLNPYVDRTDPLNIFYGNPNLRSAVNNAFNIIYSKFKKDYYFSISASHQFVNNIIQRFTSIEKDSIAATTYDNIGRRSNTNLNLNANATILKSLRINFNGSIGYLKYTYNLGNINGIQDGFVYNGNMNANLKLPSKWSIKGSIGYNSQRVMLQGKSGGFISSNVGFYKEFGTNGKVTLNVDCANPLQGERLMTYETITPTFYQMRTTLNVVRSFKATVRIRLGSFEGDISQKKRGIKNDDLKTSD